VLAPEDDSRAIEALRFSLASDIVELVVLTGDDSFLQTLREAVGPARRLWHVPSSDKVSDLLIAGGVGILVLDMQTVQEMGSRFISEIKRQFPDLVVVAAGMREDETALARSISDGTIYRFIHKPMSPARAKLFADAAVKKYDEQRKSPGSLIPAVAPRSGGLFVGIVCTAVAAALAGIWFSRRGSETESEPPHQARAAPAPELALDPADANARAGAAEAHERLLARAESALLEERLDEAANDIDAARSAGADAERVALLAGRLAKARAQIKAAADAKRVGGDRVGGDRVGSETPHTAAAATTQADELAALAIERIHEQHLIDPEQDNARFYVAQALSADATSPAALDAREQFALALLAAARAAIDRHDFAHASSWIDAAAGVASPDNLENLRHALETARRAADADAEQQLLKSAQQRLREDRLIDPDNDSAKYYLTALRGLDPASAELAQVTQDLGARLVAKGRHALTLKQYPAARAWLDEAAAIGYSAPEAGVVRHDLDAALAQQAFLENVVSANQLQLVKSVAPVYPRTAEQSAVAGWVELDFTVTESGAVQDAAVRAASPPGVFDQAALSALLQWRYQPVMRDARPIAQRARLRIRFALPH
jgi:TonB family protein